MKNIATGRLALLLVFALILSLFWGCAAGDDTTGTTKNQSNAGDAASEDPSGGDAAKTAYPNAVMYLKDGEVWLTDSTGKDPLQITQGLSRNMPVHYNNQINYMAGYFCSSGLFTLSADADYLLYPSLPENGGQNADGCYDLYMLELRAPDKAPKMIAENVTTYRASPDIKRIVYTTVKPDADPYAQYNSCLWFYDANADKTVPLAENCGYYRTSQQVDAAAFTVSSENDTNLCYWHSGGETEHIDSAVERADILLVTDSLLYYVKNECIYRYVPGEGSRILTSGVILYDYEGGASIKVYETGEMYYYKDLRQIYYKDYYTDAHAEEDAAMRRPGGPGEYDTYEVYLAAVHAYAEKESRDRARDMLNEEWEHRVNVCSFCYYDGEKETVISTNSADEFLSEYNYLETDKLKSAKYFVYDPMDITDLNLSADKIWDLVPDYGNSVCSAVPSMGHYETALYEKGYPEYCASLFDPGTDTVYLVKKNADGASDIYTADVGKNSVSAPKLKIKTGTEEVEPVTTVCGRLCWMITGDYEYIYVEGNDSPVARPSWDMTLYRDEEGRLYYTASSYNNDRWNSALVRFDGDGSSILNGPGCVNILSMLPGNAVAYLLRPESAQDDPGTLCVWADGETREIAENVTALIPTDGVSARYWFASGSLGALLYYTQR